MKKAFFFLTALLIMPIALMAQDTGTIDPNIPEYFTTLLGISTLVTLLVGFVKKWLKLTGFWAQLVAWLMGIAVAYIGWIFKWGIFSEVILWYVPLIYGVAVGLVSNGIFNIEVVKSILRLFKLEPAKNK